MRWTAQGTGEFTHGTADHLRGFEQTPLWVAPSTICHQPVLADESQQLGIHFTEVCETFLQYDRHR